MRYSVFVGIDSIPIYSTFLWRTGDALSSSFLMKHYIDRCSLWPSSLFLSEFILSYPEIFSNKFNFEVHKIVSFASWFSLHSTLPFEIRSLSWWNTRYLYDVIIRYNHVLQFPNLILEIGGFLVCAWSSYAIRRLLFSVFLLDNWLSCECYGFLVNW